MKAKIGAVPIALLTAAVFGAASAHALESRIDSVTVYPSGVEVTRVVPVSLAEGASVVTLEGLPGDIELDGVTAGAEDARVEVRFVQLDVQEQRDAYDTEVRRLEAAKTAVEDAIQEIDDRIAAAQLQLKFLEALAQEHASKERSEAASGRADVASWQQAVDAVGSGAGAVMGEMRASRQLKRERQKDLSVLQRELDSKRRQSADSASLRLSLVSETAIETTLRVSYWQWSAEWEPSYSAYLDSAASQLRLLHQAQVVQTTGEEWRDVQLRFSTFELDESIQAPDQETSPDPLIRSWSRAIGAILRLRRAGAARAGRAGAHRKGLALRKDAGSRLRDGRFRDVRERVPAAGRRRADSAGQAGVAVGGARASKAVMAP